MINQLNPEVAKLITKLYNILDDHVKQLLFNKREKFLINQAQKQTMAEIELENSERNSNTTD